jgi:hypothetical protein
VLSASASGETRDGWPYEPASAIFSASGKFGREQNPFPGFLFCKMGSRIKRSSLSAHQKQIWFFTGVGILAVTVFTALIFWLANAPDRPGR